MNFVNVQTITLLIRLPIVFFYAYFHLWGFRCIQIYWSADRFAIFIPGH